MRPHVLALAAAMLAGSGLASAADPVVGTFSGSSKSNYYLFDIETAGTFSGFVFSQTDILPGYDITTVMVNGILLDDLVPAAADYYAFSLDVLPGTMSFYVAGMSLGGGSFVGSYTVTPVPEAGAVAMALAGAGLVGGVAAARRRKAA